jgi:hypothetical protein
VSNSRLQLILFQSTNPGLQLHLPKTLPTQEVHFITIPQEKSTALLKDIKTYLGPEATITHLGHAAMVLAILRRQPLPNSTSEDEKIFYSPCWLNGRRYLRPFKDHPNPKLSYFPLCMSYAPVIFKDLDELSLSMEATREETNKALLKACKIAGEQYKKIRDQKNILPGTVALAESLANEMNQSIGAQDTESMPMEPSQDHLIADPVSLKRIKPHRHKY